MSNKDINSEDINSEEISSEEPKVEEVSVDGNENVTLENKEKAPSANKNREGKLLKNTIILAIGTFFPKLAIFLVLPAMSELLTKEDYGIYDLVTTMVALVLPVATVQIQSAAFRYLIDVKDNEKEKRKIVSTIYAFVLLTSVICLTIVFFVLFKMPIVIRAAICIYYFCDIIALVNKQIVRGLSRNIDYAISSIISGLGQIVFVYALVVGFRQELAGALIAMAIAEFLSMSYLFVRGKILSMISFKEVDKATLKELLLYSWPMVPNSLSQWVIHASDRLVITGVLGLAANGIYSMAYKIPSILSMAQTTFNMAWQENASISASDDDVSEYFSSMFRMLFDIVSGMMSVLIGFTPLLFFLFIHGDYSESYNQIPILFMGMFFLCLSTFWGGIFVAIKQTKAAGTTTIIAAAINLLIDVCTVKWIGLYAGSISSVTAYFVMCLLRAGVVKKYIKIDYDIKHIVCFVCILIAQCIICFQRNMILNGVNFVVGIAVCLLLNYKLALKILNKVLRLKKK